jgi:integrase/recombinase XerD
VDRVLAVAKGSNERDFVLLAVLFYTGLRIGNAASLKVSDVFQYGRITESFVLAKQEMKGARAHRVYVPQKLAKILLPYVHKVFGQNEFLFPSRNGEGHLNKAYASQLVRAVFAKAGIDEPSHACRKSFATRLAVEKGTSIVVVSALLGHKNLATTQKYVFANEVSLAGAVNLL